MSEGAAEYVDPKSLTPWARNPRHNDEAVAGVVESIRRFGFASPILARRENREVIAGHTRLKAALSMGLDAVPVRWLDLDAEEAHALALADNKLGEVATWDDAEVAAILGELEKASVPVDGLGWTSEELDAMLNPSGSGEPEKYTRKIEPPVYTPTGPCPPLSELVDRTRADSLIAEIDAAPLPDDVAAFLRWAAERHVEFNFRGIAEYYAHAEPPVQDLMERSALVILDFERALELGYVKLTKRLAALAGMEHGEGGDDEG